MAKPPRISIDNFSSIDSTEEEELNPDGRYRRAVEGFQPFSAGYSGKSIDSVAGPVKTAAMVRSKSPTQSRSQSRSQSRRTSLSDLLEARRRSSVRRASIIYFISHAGLQKFVGKDNSLDEYQKMALVAEHQAEQSATLSEEAKEEADKFSYGVYSEKPSTWQNLRDKEDEDSGT
jgi:hypothetical protein